MQPVCSIENYFFIDQSAKFILVAIEVCQKSTYSTYIETCNL